jgi:hypothetical protein
VRLILFLAGTVTAGAIGITQGIFPLPTQMLQTLLAPGSDPEQAKSNNGKAVDAHNQVLPQILRGSRIEDVGFHGSVVTLPPGGFRRAGSGPVNVGTMGENRFASNTASQIQQSNLRLQDMATYTRNPTVWHGAPPH